MENINETQDIKYKTKKSKSKNNIDFGLLNALEFGQINNYINNDNILNTTNENKNKDKKKKNKDKDKHAVQEQINLNKNIIELKTNDDNNTQSAYSDYLEKKFLKNNSLINKKNDIFAIDLKDNNKNDDDNLKNKNNSKNILNNEINEIKQIKSTKSSNPIIQNEVIWYSDELDSDELELKYKNKYNKNIKEINENKPNKNILDENINNLLDNLIIGEQIFDNNEINKTNENNNIINSNENISILSIISDTFEVEKIITGNPQITIVKKVYKSVVDCKKCIFECKKLDSNIFELDINCDPNCSSYKIFNNQICCSHILNIIFMADGKIYNPELVEIYINGVLIKKLYSDVINNLPNVQANKTHAYYYITDSAYPLTSDTVITMKIQDKKQVDKVFFNVLLEKIISEQISCLNDNIKLDFFSTTHELLYEGIESIITIGLDHGYYQDIYIVCDDIINNINSISITNSDVVLLQDIPIQLLEYTQNLLCYSLKINETVISGIKIDSDLDLKIKLNKSNPNSKVKIYGNKLFILEKDIVKRYCKTK